MKSRAQSQITVSLALVGTLAYVGSVLAEDYSVDVGVDTDRGRDASTLHCQYGKPCDSKMRSLGLGISLLISHDNPAFVDVRLSGDNAGCCYFAYARDAIVVDARTPLSRVPIFKGFPARGGLFVENESAGTLYLRFRLP